MSFYIDLSEFLTNPITTGIQRISGEMCKYLPDNAVTIIRIHRDGYVALPKTLVKTIGDYFERGSQIGAAEIVRLGDPKNGTKIEITRDDSVLVPEVFEQPQRLAFFQNMADEELARHRFIAFDLLPVTHPEYFWADKLGTYRYYKLLRRASNCGFISQDTMDAYHDRLRRSRHRDGVVLPLGADSLGPRVTIPALNRPLTFSVIGTVEPRKNHELILESFEPLLRQIEGLKLMFLGRIGWVTPEFAQRVESLAADKNSGFEFCPAPSDNFVKASIEQSRATIYVSEAEGYGIPPVESLWAGTPVIASTTIPSLKRLGPAGIHYVHPLNAINLRRAVLAFIDNGYANQKAKEAVAVDLPTWRSFTQAVVDWWMVGHSVGLGN